MEELWLPRDSPIASNNAQFMEDWGMQNLDRVLLLPKNGGNFFSFLFVCFFVFFFLFSFANLCSPQHLISSKMPKSITKQLYSLG